MSIFNQISSYILFLWKSCVSAQPSDDNDVTNTHSNASTFAVTEHAHTHTYTHPSGDRRLTPVVVVQKIRLGALSPSRNVLLERMRSPSQPLRIALHVCNHALTQCTHTHILCIHYHYMPGKPDDPIPTGAHSRIEGART